MKNPNFNKLKVAVIGCGYWGSIITNSLLKIGIRNIYIYDQNYRNSLILKKKYKNLMISKSYKYLLNDKTITFFFFATPPSINFKIVKKAIIKNKMIFLEKPGFVKVKEFKKINALLDKMKKFIMFGYIYCFNNYINCIKKIIQSKKLGKILYIRFQRENLGPIRTDVNSSYDLSSHDLSIILHIFNKLPKLIKHIDYPVLKKNISDISNLHMRLDNTYIDINSSWLNPIKVRTITIVGEKKMLFFDELNLDNPLRIYDKYAKYPDMSKFDKKFINSKAQIYEGNSKSITIRSKSPLINEIKHFFFSMKNKKKPLTNNNFSYQIINFLNRIN